MVFILWSYHRVMCRLSYPPSLADKRAFDLLVVPQMRGLVMVCSVAAVPFFLGLGFMTGELGSFRLPWAQCSPEQAKETCFLGVFDWVSSSYGGETAVSITTYGERRTGRAGTLLVIIGGYAISIALKLLVPVAESNYYRREEKNAEIEMKNILGEEKPVEKKEPKSDLGSADGDEEEEEEEMPPIFTTHLWKRSSLALLIYGNAVFQTCVLRLSFSDMFKDNGLMFLLVLLVTRSCIRIAFTNFMCELMLVVSITVTNQAMAIITLLASPTLFDFLIMYIALAGIQMVERLYIGPNEEMIIKYVKHGFRSCERLLTAIRHADKNVNDSDKKEESDEEDTVQKDGVEPTFDTQAEEMIGFIATMTADAASNWLLPIFFALCMFLFDESEILVSFGIPKHNTQFFMFFYIMMLPFQLLSDKICINIAECYHGWHVTEYLEYCNYRYLVRTTDWKGNDNQHDQTLSPHVRSLDQMCFSDQYYYVNLLMTFGILSWIFGMQVCFTSGWNIFDDPASPMVLFMGLCLCKGSHSMSLVSAGYLKVWVVNIWLRHQQQAQQALQQKMSQQHGQGQKEKPPPPPMGSVHEGWVEPATYDANGMERYRLAFLSENQLWLQAQVSEIKEQKTILENRTDLLDGLADLLNEVGPKSYAPEGIDDVEKDAFAFGAPPQLDLARAAGEVQRDMYQNSALRNLVKMWRERAQFMLHLSQVSSMVKLNNHHIGDACEMCGQTVAMQALVCSPIYTLLHLASLYREQRDMSSLWNTTLWKHFYATFTPTCTLCQDCGKFYHTRNKNVPVAEKRAQKLKVKKLSAFEAARSSNYPIIALDQETIQVLQTWLGITRAFAAGEAPVDFLPRFGIDGRTAAEIRREMIIANAGEDDDESLPSFSESEEEDPTAIKLPPPGTDPEEAAQMRAAAAAAAAEAQRKKGLKDPLQIDLEDDGDMPLKWPYKVPSALSWSEQAIMMSWLSKARESLEAPQISTWAHPGKAGVKEKPKRRRSNQGKPGQSGEFGRQTSSASGGPRQPGSSTDGQAKGVTFAGQGS
eukprot:TRINITY_DN6609_c2_g2_i1.p1 TRINITY_DN6609_c2_g2~~TRINITY_DN6609_c2_g2_i1.p1  ORF type:complete len:1191 (-),score=286.08 TRINITY_DN6609_c2_g2_i1:195-3314(-)